jgi:hypothetical protein
MALARNRVILPAGFAILRILIQIPFLSRYGYHSDELYFLACGSHLSFGYVDHPPLVPWLARLADLLFGQSLAGLRILGVLAEAGAVFMTGLLVLRLGGGAFAVLMACLSMMCAPVFIRASTMLTIPGFEPIIWVSCAYLLVRVIQEKKKSTWLWIGLLLGVGLMAKHSTLFLVFGIGVGLVLTPLRRYLKTRWPYLAAAIALAVFLPNLVWQVQNGWPTVEFLLNLNRGVMSGISRIGFLMGQILYLNPFAAPVWISGLVFFLFKGGKSYRILGVIYAAVFTLLVIVRSKVYYLAPAYPALIAGGGVAFERFLKKQRAPWLKPAASGILLAASIGFAPISLPIFPVSVTDRLCNAVTFGLLDSSSEITAELHRQFGWEERAEAVAEVYGALSNGERESTVIYGDWYGIAGAVDFYGAAYGLPKAVSGHMTYYLWGLPAKRITTVIYAGAWELNSLRRLFSEVTLAAAVTLENVNPWDRRFLVALCRGPRMDVHDMWPLMKSF